MTGPSKSGLELAISQKLEARRSKGALRKLRGRNAEAVDFSSNDFLSLSSSSELRHKVLRTIQAEHQQARSLFGSGSSRLLGGNSTYAEDLERDIAAFHNAPAGLFCNSGFDANVGLFAALPQPKDVIIYDELIHASVHDGMRLSRAAKRMAFRHNDVSSLREALRSCIQDNAKLKDGASSVFVAVESVYSMDGDLAPLQEIRLAFDELLPQRNGHLIVDEAHATGIVGPQGRGLVSELGLEDAVTVRLHTFGKAMACSGAIMLCSPTIREYLINYARPLIYTTSAPFASLAAIRASYTFLQQGKAEPLVHHLHTLIDTFHLSLLRLSERLQLPDEHQHLLRVSGGRPRSPIFSIMCSRSQELAAHCRQNSFLVYGVVAPTVPRGQERLRVCLHAGNTVQEVEGLVRLLKAWVRKAATEHQVNAGRMTAKL